MRIAAVTKLLDIKHVFDKNPLQVNEVTAGTATSVFSQQYARVRMSTSANNDLVIRQTKTRPIYQPGKSQLFEGSFSNFQIEANVIKRIGCFNSFTGSPYNSVFDGFFLESNGITSAHTFNIYRTGTLVYSADSTSWDSTEFNPTGITWSNTNLMTADYQWLGVGRMRFGLNLSGKTFYFAEHTSANNEPNVYMSSPNQPIRYEIRSSGGTGYLDMICTQVCTEGSLNGLYSTVGVSQSASTTINAGVKGAFIGLRLKQNYKSVVSEIINNTIINTTNVKREFIVTIEFNPSLNFTPTWVNVDQSPFQYALGSAGNSVTGNSGYIISSFVVGADTSVPTVLEFNDNQIRIGSNVNGTLDEMWVCITPLDNNATFRGSVNQRYYL